MSHFSEDSIGKLIDNRWNERFGRNGGRPSGQGVSPRPMLLQALRVRQGRGGFQQCAPPQIGLPFQPGQPLGQVGIPQPELPKASLKPPKITLPEAPKPRFPFGGK